MVIVYSYSVHRDLPFVVVSLFDQLSRKKEPRLHVTLQSSCNTELKCVSCKNCSWLQFIFVSHIITWSWCEIFMSLDNFSIFWKIFTFNVLERSPLVYIFWQITFCTAHHVLEKTKYINACMNLPIHHPHTLKMAQTPLLLLLSVLIEYSSSLIKEA